MIAECPEDFGQRNFSPSSYTNEQNKQQPMYHVFFDGFILLVMGYTGPKALRMKLAYIEAFNAMQAKIESQSRLGGDSPITIEMQKALQAIIRARLEALGLNMQQFRGWAAQLFIRMNHHFSLRSYKELPQAKLAEAIDFLMKLELPARKIEAAPQAEAGRKLEGKPMPEEEPELDHDTYETGKKIFDLLVSARFNLETATGHMLFLFGARSASLDPDKQALYDNLTDCARAAGASIQSAILNIKSACRIKSRVEFRKW